MVEEKTASQELIIKLLERKGLLRIHQIMVQSETEGKAIDKLCNKGYSIEEVGWSIAY